MTYEIISIIPYTSGMQTKLPRYQLKYRRPNGSINFVVIFAKDELDAFAKGLKHVEKTANYAAFRRQQTIDRKARQANNE